MFFVVVIPVVFNRKKISSARQRNPVKSESGLGCVSILAETTTDEVHEKKIHLPIGLP